MYFFGMVLHNRRCKICGSGQAQDVIAILRCNIKGEHKTGRAVGSQMRPELHINIALVNVPAKGLAEFDVGQTNGVIQVVQGHILLGEHVPVQVIDGFPNLLDVRLEVTPGQHIIAEGLPTAGHDDLLVVNRVADQLVLSDGVPDGLLLFLTDNLDSLLLILFQSSLRKGVGRSEAAWRFKLTEFAPIRQATDKVPVTAAGM